MRRVEERGGLRINLCALKMLSVVFRISGEGKYGTKLFDDQAREFLIILFNSKRCVKNNMARISRLCYLLSSIMPFELCLI